MKKHFISVLLIAMVICSCAQSKTKVSYLFDTEKLLERQEILSSDKFESRRTGEKGNDSARAFIINQFMALNILGFEGNYEQAFTFNSIEKTLTGTNVLAEIKGTQHSEKYIVISAHHDHLGIINGEIYNGADDDASGVSALISFAEYLVENPPRHSVIFAAFDAEEIGLQGAKHFVRTMDSTNVILNINMDMISRSPKDELYVVGGRYTKPLETIISAFDNPTATTLLVGHDGTDGKQNWTMSSDHTPFHKKGIPFLYFGNEDHKAYHKPTDDFESITPEFYKNAVQIILSIFLEIDDAGL